MIEIVKQGICVAIACCDVDPEAATAFDQVDKELLNIPTGAESCPWQTTRPGDEDYTSINAPIPCQNIAGRWHYLVYC